MLALACHHLTVGYGKKAVCSDIDFSLEQGECLCIIGENGAGKSTFIKTLLRQLTPLSGAIEFGPGFASGQLGYVAQRTEIQSDFPASVREVVLSGLLAGRHVRPILHRAQKFRALRALHLLGMEQSLNCSFQQLSGGQQQRVLLARALCAAESCLLLDEPTAGLDHESTEEFNQLLKTLRERGITILLVSHDLAAVRLLATKVLHLSTTAHFHTAANCALLGGKQ